MQQGLKSFIIQEGILYSALLSIFPHNSNWKSVLALTKVSWCQLFQQKFFCREFFVSLSRYHIWHCLKSHSLCPNSQLPLTQSLTKGSIELKTFMLCYFEMWFPQGDGWHWQGWTWWWKIKMVFSWRGLEEIAKTMSNCFRNATRGVWRKFKAEISYFLNPEMIISTRDREF